MEVESAEGRAERLQREKEDLQGRLDAALKRRRSRRCLRGLGLMPTTQVREKARKWQSRAGRLRPRQIN